MGASALLSHDALGCAGKSLGPVSAETLIGRWRALTKGDAETVARGGGSVDGPTVVIVNEQTEVARFFESE